MILGSAGLLFPMILGRAGLRQRLQQGFSLALLIRRP
jgi:hypothetical protein